MKINNSLFPPPGFYFIFQYLKTQEINFCFVASRNKSKAFTFDGLGWSPAVIGTNNLINSENSGIILYIFPLVELKVSYEIV